MLGTDFVTFVHWKHSTSSSSPRGVPAIYPALGKIVLCDALTTALHERLTNHNLPDYYLTSAGLRDPDNMSVPPPSLAGLNSVSGVLLKNGVTLDALPSGWDIRSSVAQLDYMGHLNTIKEHYDLMVKTDLSELAWYEISEASGDMSGKALTYRLSPVKSKIDQARGNAESALIQITQMCLTVGQNLGLPGFDAGSIGTFETGAFDFWIADRPIVPLSEEERLSNDQTRAQTMRELTDAGVGLDVAALQSGYTQEQADAMFVRDRPDGVTQ
jgi:hypothetical protein